MTQLWDFSGGIHPPEHKHQSTARPIRQAGIPERLVIPLQQHIGNRAEPVVSTGERVLKGQKIADVTSGLGAPVHAPTSGIIENIGPHPVPHPSGLDDLCIFLRPDGEDQWRPRAPVTRYQDLERQQVLQIIREAGISGMGGAGFPTSVKLNPPKDRKVHTLILNGAECEPYITADDMTMRERADEIAAGLSVMAWLLRSERCVIGIEDNKPEAAEAMRRACEGTMTEVVVIPTKYPSGSEKQLIRILTGLEVPSGGIPADVGVVCQNVGTAVAVARAVFSDEPLISRVVTITGEAVREAGNFEALIGTPVSFLLEQAGYEPDKAARLILGGPMMGFTLPTDKAPLTKTSNCVIAATATELPEPPPEQPCIRCGQCAQACPMELLPQQLLWYSRSEEFEKAEHLNLFDCIECGACAYVCPSSIPLVQYYRHAKGEIRKLREEQAKADRARERFEARQARLERERQEKEQRRRERARAAAEAQARKRAEAAKAESAGSTADDRAAKAAQVRQALERKKAAAGTDQTSAANPEADLEALEKQRLQAKAKLETMQGLLAEARARQADNIDKLERAVAKNEERLRRAEQALAQARQSVPDTSASGTTH